MKITYCYNLNCSASIINHSNYTNYELHVLLCEEINCHNLMYALCVNVFKEIK